MAEYGKNSTVAVYPADLERLKALQRRISAQRNIWVTMPEMIQEMISAVEAAGQGA
jgi:predicted dinucleotide-utilizing enzyme